MALSFVSEGIIFDAFVAVALLLFGILLGKAISVMLKKISKETSLEKAIQPSFIGLIITVIRWSIYLVFINLALAVLEVPELTFIVSKVLIAIPAIVASLVLVVVGFAIAVYIREVVEDSEVTGWKFLSEYIYYFIVYISGIYALNIALVSVNETTRDFILVILTAIVFCAIAVVKTKEEIRKR